MQPRFLLFAFVFSFAAFNTYAQNTFPSSGNVGIGTTSPIRKLHIVDAVDRGGGYFKPLVMYNPNLAKGQHVQLALGRANSNYNQGVVNFNLAGGVGSANNTLSLGLYGNPNVLNVLGTGNVGIGTPTPLARLGVRRTDGIPKLAKFTNGSTSGDRSALVELQSGDNALWRIGVGGTGNGSGLTGGHFISTATAVMCRL